MSQFEIDRSEIIYCVNWSGWNSGDARSKYNADISGIVANKIRLPDGRHIAYEERGVSRDVAKRNILVLHGFLSCRLAGINCPSSTQFPLNSPFQIEFKHHINTKLLSA